MTPAPPRLPPTGDLDPLGALGGPTGDVDVLAADPAVRRRDADGIRETAPPVRRRRDVRPPTPDPLWRDGVTPVVDQATGPQEWLNRQHDEMSPLGRVRRVWFEKDEDAGPRALFEWDPYAF